MLTMGVEEEFFLLAPDGSVAPTAPRAIRIAGLPAQVKPEYTAYQVETNTRVCTDLTGLRRELTRLRLIAADAAERTGAHLVASGTAPFAAGPLHALTDHARYREPARRLPAATGQSGTCACHVHIGMPDRDLGVAVLTRMRPYLPALLALTVNSPYAGTHDTGWASYRYHARAQRPAFRPPAPWPPAAECDHAAGALTAAGPAADLPEIHYLARLSPRYPTLELQVADTCPTVEDTVLLAAVARALVAALVEDIRQRVEAVPVPSAIIRGQLLAAAYGRLQVWPAPAGSPVNRLLEKTAPFVGAEDDAAQAHAALARLRRDGTGADRQRELWRRHGASPAFVRALAESAIPASGGAQPAPAAAGSGLIPGG
jgi:glutamate---cysteine ligase / carboxylate-amine ligase